MGRDEAAPNKVTSATSIASTVQSIESTLDMLTNENLILERDTDFLERLQKEKVWLEVEVKTKHMNSLVNAVTLLKEKKSEAEQKMLSLKSDVPCDDATSPLGQLQ